MLKRLASLLLSVLLLLAVVPAPVAQAAGLPFTDVPRNAWYYDNVSLAYGKDLVRGVSQTSFDPNGSMLIIQAVTLAARMHQLVHEGSVTLRNDPFVWYESYASYADRNGIIYSNEYWDRLDEPIDRALFVRIFYNVMDDYAAKNTVETGSIPDVAVSDPAAEAIYAFYRAGILTGSDEQGTFRPDSSIQRCEVAAIVSRMLQPAQRLSISLTAPGGPGEAPWEVEWTPSDCSNAPGLDAAVTLDNVYAILDAIDWDGAYLMRETVRRGDDPLVWWGRTTRLTPRLSAAVHEQCHAYASYNGGWEKVAIYLGDGEYIVVPETDVFNSLQMAQTIPEELRTFRYSYVGEAQQYLTSQTDGPYGLLDELTAYCWGAHTNVRLYDYYLAKATSASDWLSYIHLLSSDYYAYAEFKYFILHYLVYAQENDPAVYRGIVGNTAFRTAYAAIDDRFAAVVDAVQRRFEDVADHLRSEGHSVTRSGGYFYIDGSGAGTFEAVYDLLATELAKPVYQQMDAVLHG